MNSEIWIQIKILMWKNFIFRKRSLFITFMEICCPIIAYHMATLPMIGYTTKDEIKYGNEYSAKLIYEKFSSRTTICYAPKTNFSSTLMEKVKVKVDKDIQPFDNESSLFQYFKSYRKIPVIGKNLVGIIFKKIEGEKPPEHLNYVIVPYTMDNVNIKSLFYYNSLLMRTNRRAGDPVYLKNGFLAMQLAVDTSYIEIISSSDLPGAVHMQSLPAVFSSQYDLQMLYFLQYSLYMVYGFLPTAVLTLGRIAEEKHSGIKELMKMMGLKSWMLWSGWFLNVFSCMFVSVVWIVITDHVRKKIIAYCSASLFMIFLLLYCTAGIMFFFAISTLFYRPQGVAIFGVIAWCLSYHYIGPRLDNAVDKTRILKFMSMLWPNAAVFYGFRTIGLYDMRKVNLGWTNIYESADRSNGDITMGNVIFMLLFDIILYMAVTFYFDNIYPGPDGVGKSFGFPITYLRGMLLKTSKVQHEEQAVINTDDEICKIQPAPDLKPEIQIRDLYKRYGITYAVNGLSMDIYEQQITVLLGHNGAGKTTTLYIVTGMCAPTSGKVFIDGLDIASHMDEVRREMGFCPQHNLQFSNLTVMEHLQFFGMLKGLSLENATEQAEALLKDIKLDKKHNAFASALSGGMKRRLSLAIALIGDPKVIILDEPTSGLDPELRREIWDLLHAIKGSRTIIITTHYMEEADVLGDRIAIMDHGQLVCYGTSMYLKNEFGAGYHLTVIGSDKEKTITALVQRHISTATLHSSIGTTLNYLLPHEMKPIFRGLLAELENRKSTLGITNFSLSITTLEEVFLSASKAPSQVGGDVIDLSFRMVPLPKATGTILFRMQILALLKKRLYFLFQDWLTYFVVMTILLFITFIEFNLSAKSAHPEKLELDLKMYGRTTVFYGGTDSVTKMEEKYHNIVEGQLGTPKRVKNVSDEVIRTAKEHIAYYSHFVVVGAEFNNSNVTAMYSEVAYHSSPISLNLVMNAMLKGIMGNKYSIHVTNFPQGSNIDRLFRFLQWKILFPFGLSLLLTVFLGLPIAERISNVKQLQLMCGVRPVTYWSVSYLFDAILYCISIAIVMTSIVIYGEFNPNTGIENKNTLFILWLIYGLTTIPVVYLFSYKKSVGAASTYFILLNLIANMAALISEIKMLVNHETSPPPLHKLCTITYPPYGIFRLLTRVAVQATERKKCTFKDCSDSYFLGRYSIFEVYWTVMCSISSAVAYFGILLLLECNLLYKVIDIILNYCTYRILGKRDDSDDNDDTLTDVENEANRISAILTEGRQNVGRTDVYEELTASELLMVHGIEKRYGTHKVVKGVSFAVNYGDCFGLLGVSGAGKTTIFRILSGDLPLTFGDARIVTPIYERVYLSMQPQKYLGNVGYCPQHDAISEILTGRQMLTLFAELRGIAQGVQAEFEAERHIIALGLREFADKPCGQYSGGNKRKLSVAISLIAQPALVMLDEPTSGVDPVSRRKLWNILSALNTQIFKMSIILTSHSMDECETLCNRLAIMKAGQLECCGKLSNLKEKYGQGFTVMLKVTPTLSVGETPGTSTGKTTENDPQVKQMMLAFEQKYKDHCTLKDQYPGNLTYYINDTSKKLHKLFNELEALKLTYPVVEDYNISETSLEDIFLSIAQDENKKQNE